jgi:hypothetical protein
VDFYGGECGDMTFKLSEVNKYFIVLTNEAKLAGN